MIANRGDGPPQDFEALTPNLLARTIETIEGGGIIVLLLSNMSSLTQLYNLTMDVHARLRTESHQEVVGELGTSFPLHGKSCLLISYSASGTALGLLDSHV